MEVFLAGAGVEGIPWMLPGGSDTLLQIMHLGNYPTNFTVLERGLEITALKIMLQDFLLCNNHDKFYESRIYLISNPWPRLYPLYIFI